MKPLVLYSVNKVSGVNHIISFNLNYFKQFEISQIQTLLFSPIFIFEEINYVKSLIFWKILVLFYPNFGRFHNDHPQVSFYF